MLRMSESLVVRHRRHMCRYLPARNVLPNTFRRPSLDSCDGTRNIRARYW